MTREKPQGLRNHDEQSWVSLVQRRANLDENDYD
jgi:hypothetical protein